MNLKELLFEADDERAKIKAWLDKHKIKSYKINADLTVDVAGDVNLIGSKLDKLPVRFGKVIGYFICSGCPKLSKAALGFLKIRGLKEVFIDNEEVKEIINRYLPNTRGNRAILDCQSELLDAGLEKYAELWT